MQFGANKDLIEQLGSRFMDLLVADALYMQKPFIDAVEALRLQWVINLKDNQPEAQRLTSGVSQERPGDPPELQLWHAPEVYWPVADRAVGVAKTVRTQEKKRWQIRREQGTEARGKRNLHRDQYQFLRRQSAVGRGSTFVHPPVRPESLDHQ